MSIDTITLSLTVVREARTFVEVVDEAGNHRSFERDRYAIIVNDGVAEVVVPRKAWERRMKRLPEKAPTYEQAPLKTKKKCLLCNHGFMSEPQIRICSPCKSTANWKSGGGYAVYK